jgi:hypothetical protein
MTPTLLEHTAAEATGAPSRSLRDTRLVALKDAFHRGYIPQRGAGWRRSLAKPSHLHGAGTMIE